MNEKKNRQAWDNFTTWAISRGYRPVDIGDLDFLTDMLEEEERRKALQRAIRTSNAIIDSIKTN